MCAYTQPVGFPVDTHNPPTLLSKVPSQLEMFQKFTSWPIRPSVGWMRLGGGAAWQWKQKQHMRVYLLSHVRAEYDSYVLNHLMGRGGGMTVWINCAVLLLQFTDSSRRIQANSLCPHIGLHLLYHPPPISLSDPRGSICAAVVFKFTPSTAVTLQRRVRLINFWAINRINWGIFSQILLSVNGSYN